MSQITENLQDHFSSILNSVSLRFQCYREMLSSQEGVADEHRRESEQVQAEVASLTEQLTAAVAERNQVEPVYLDAFPRCCRL